MFVRMFTVALLVVIQHTSARIAVGIDAFADLSLLQHSLGKKSLVGSSLGEDQNLDQSLGSPIAALLNTGDQKSDHSVTTLLRILKYCRRILTHDGTTSRWVLWPLVIVGAIAGIAAAIWISSAKIFEKAMQDGIKKFAHLDVDFDSLRFNPFSGFLHIHGFVIRNPEPFKSEYFLKAKVITFDLRMGKLISSGGKLIEVDELTFKEVEVIIEYTGFWPTKSNVQAISDKVSGADTKSKAVSGSDTRSKKPAEPQEPAKPEEADPKKPAQAETDPKKQTRTDSGTKTTLHKVVLEDVGMKVATKLLGTRVSAGDIKYEDFDKEVGHSMVDDIALEILKTLTKTLLETMAGKNFANRFL